MWAISLLMGLLSPTFHVSSYEGYHTVDGFEVTEGFVTSYVGYLTVDGFVITEGFVTSYVGYLTVDGFVVTNISCVKLCRLSHCWQI